MDYVPGSHWIEYADGTYARYFKKKIIVGDSGIKKWKIWLFPGKELSGYHGLKIGEDIDPKTGMMKKEYDYNEVHIIRSDPGYSKLWIETDLMGNPTQFSLRNQHLKEQIKDLQKTVATLKAGIAKKSIDMNQALSNNMEFIQNLSDMMSALQKPMPKIREDEEEGYPNE